MAIRVEASSKIEISNVPEGQNRFADNLVHSVTAVSPGGEVVPMGWFQAYSDIPGAWIGPPPLAVGSEHIDLSQPGSTATFQRNGIEIRYISVQLEGR